MFLNFSIVLFALYLPFLYAEPTPNEIFIVQGDKTEIPEALHPIQTELWDQIKYHESKNYKVYYIPDIQISTLLHVIKSPRTALIYFSGHSGAIDGQQTLLAYFGSAVYGIDTQLVKDAARASNMPLPLSPGNPNLWMIAASCKGMSCSVSFDALGIKNYIGPSENLRVHGKKYFGRPVHWLIDETQTFLQQKDVRRILYQLPAVERNTIQIASLEERISSKTLTGPWLALNAFYGHFVDFAITSEKAMSQELLKRKAALDAVMREEEIQDREAARMKPKNDSCVEMFAGYGTKF